MKLNDADFGVKIRDEYLIVGYFNEWLVAQDSNDDFYVMKEPLHIYTEGTYCDADSELHPISFLPEDEYKQFVRDFLGEE